MPCVFLRRLTQIFYPGVETHTTPRINPRFAADAPFWPLRGQICYSWFDNVPVFLPASRLLTIYSESFPLWRGRNVSA